MNEREMEQIERKLRKQSKRLLKWCRKHGFEKVDIYVNTTDSFTHAFIAPEMPSWWGVIDDE